MYLHFSITAFYISTKVHLYLGSVSVTTEFIEETSLVTRCQVLLFVLAKAAMDRRAGSPRESTTPLRVRNGASF